MPEDKVQKWEYLVEQDTGMGKVKINGVKYESRIEYLNEMGNNGWELVQGPTHNISCYYFKRPKL